MVKKVLSIGKLTFHLQENILAYNIREMSALPHAHQANDVND